MKKLIAWLGLKITGLAILLYESKPWGILSSEDKNSLRQLWEMHDRFLETLGDK